MQRKWQLTLHVNEEFRSERVKYPNVDISSIIRDFVLYAASYLTWLKFIFDTMLEALALHLHGREDQAVPYEMRWVAYSFASFETANRDESSTNQWTSIKTHRGFSCQPRPIPSPLYFVVPILRNHVFRTTGTTVVDRMEIELFPREGMRSNCFRMQRSNEDSFFSPPIFFPPFFVLTQTEPRLIKFERTNRTRKNFSGTVFSSLAPIFSRQFFPPFLFSLFSFCVCSVVRIDR